MSKAKIQELDIPRYIHDAYTNVIHTSDVDGNERPLSLCHVAVKAALKAQAQHGDKVREGLVEALKEAYIVMTGKEGSNSPFDAERWAKAITGIEWALAASGEGE